MNLSIQAYHSGGSVNAIKPKKLSVTFSSNAIHQEKQHFSSATELKKVSTANILALNKFSVSFRGFKNLNKVNPFEMLETPNSAEALKDYICNGMFIHMPKMDDKKFGEVFWSHFLKSKETLGNVKNSDVIYSRLRNMAENLSSPQELDKAASKQVSERATTIGSVVKNFFAENDVNITRNTSFLDVGCGNGEVAKSIAQELQISDANVRGLEILERDDFCNIPRFRFDGQNIPKSFPKADLVTIFNVLHHTQNDDEAKSLLKSVYDNMNEGGTLIIRDHNVSSPNDIKYWQVRHLLPIRVSKVDPPCLVQDNVYHSVDEWSKILTDIGFKPKFVKTDGEHGSIFSFYLAVQK